MKKALIVGIDKYSFAQLRCCVKDASYLHGIIELNEDGTRNFDAKLVVDIQKKADLLNNIRDLFSGRYETALLYFSGHGFINDLGGYLVTPDAKQYDEGIAMDVILNLANNSPADNKILILDCCNAGAMGTSQITGGLVTQLKDGVTILAASMHNQQAVEAGNHGVFTGFLLDALRGGAADLQGNITPASIYAYIDKALGPWSQRPVFKTNTTRFVTLRNMVPKLTLETLKMIPEYFPLPDQEFQLDPEFEISYPNSKPDKIIKFKHLQKLYSQGLVTPLGEVFMFWAAVNSKSCKLTHLGSYYWRLVKDRRI